MAAQNDPTRNDLKEFLTTRRSRITPEQAGLPVYAANRRVTGLRREEVALLAGISVEYYTRLERGSVGSVSDGVLDGLVHALQLDEAERDHLYRLVRAAGTSAGRAPRRTPVKMRVRPIVQRILDQMPMPAYVRNGRFDVLAANDPGRALYSPLYDHAAAHTPGRPPNSARFCFLDPVATEFFVDYDKAANGWYKGVMHHHEGAISWDGKTREVSYIPDATVDDELDAAYLKKYGSGSPTSAITNAAARATTLR